MYEILNYIEINVIDNYVLIVKGFVFVIDVEG